MNKFLSLFILSIVLQSHCYANGYPQDVADFMDKTDACIHFSGEVSGDAEMDKARKLGEKIKQYCTGIEKDFTLLKQKYANDPAVIKALNSYADIIEFAAP